MVKKGKSGPAYLSVFDRISTEIGRQSGNTPVFFIIWTQSFHKVRKLRHEQCEFVASEAECSVSV